ncbi:MAG: response regulator transcription factor [Verrucomicrobiota bacterium]
MNSPLSVLIADDHPIFRKGLCDVIEEDSALRLAGQAGNGEEALRLVETLRPDVAVLDINMPKFSGLQVARSLGERRSPVKLVLLTMHEDEDLFDEAMEIGVKAYVLKESAVEDLLTAVHAVAAGGSFISAPIAGLLVKRREQAATLRREKPGLELLTPSERRILRLIAEDRTTKEIAEALEISPRTVETHRQNMSHKLHLSGSHSLLKFAFDHKTHL